MLKKIFLLIILAFLLSACGPVQQETDQEYLVEKKFNSNLYYLSLELEKEPSNYSQLNGSFSRSSINGFGFMSSSILLDGKGLVRGKITQLSPEADFASVEDIIIIKTTDFKVMALRPGDKADFVCTIYFEPVCAADGGWSSDITECYEIWEFDYCRLKDFDPMD